MATIKPFKAIRPTKETAKDIAALPYDVYNRKEAKEEIQDKPLSFLRIDRGETTLDDSVDIYDPLVYQHAKDIYNQFLEEGKFVREEEPAFYIYELTMDGKSQTGLVATCSVDEYIDNTIKKHELTREDKEQDRINHVDTLDANTGPIFLTYRNKKEINNLIDDLKQEEPFVSFESDDNVRHRVWIVNNKEVLDELVNYFKDVDNFYIADGHHRCASAIAVAKKRREAFKDYSGDEEFNYFLSVLFPDNNLNILDYNRVVKDLNGLSKEEFLKALDKDFIVELKEDIVKPEQKGTFGMFLDDNWYLLTYKGENPDNIIDNLDVSILNNNLLQPILGIKDPRTDKRIGFVGGIRGLKELEDRVHDDMEVAFSMYPTSIEELITIADNNLLMPPKSTWFEPKLRSGLFVHELS